MSKSLNQVTQYLIANEIEYELRKTDQIARTAQEAADGIGCHLNQIVKSIIFSAPSSDSLVLFLTAGGNFVDVHKVESLLGFTLQKADAQIIRFQTGFVIGSVPPFAHKEELAVYMDPELLNHSLIWAVAGTPFHLFSINSEVLLATTKAKTLNSVIPTSFFRWLFALPSNKLTSGIEGPCPHGSCFRLFSRP